jgi:hypothetical protein
MLYLRNERQAKRITYCERPGGGSEFEDIEAKVNAWITAALPERPNGEQPRMAQQRKDQRKRSDRSKSRSRDKPRRHEVYPEGYNPWDYGEEVEKRRKHALLMLFAARKELADTGKVSEELKRGFQTVREQYGETDAPKQIAEFQETLPCIERMNELQRELQEKQKEEHQGRLDKGELRSITSKLRPEGLGSYEEDNPGATSSAEPMPSIKAFKVIKIELKEDEPKE